MTGKGIAVKRKRDKSPGSKESVKKTRGCLVNLRQPLSYKPKLNNKHNREIKIQEAI
jgi:hypothetical protein